MSMSPELPIIRRVLSRDSENIASLMQQLGYEATPSQISDRLRGIQDSSTDLVLVAAIEDSIVGCISLHLLPLFHADGFLGRITSFVIDQQHRRLGVGSTLMRAASEWFSASGCVKIEVTSGDHRSDAHRFYEAQGFSRDRQRFSKRA
ncbi:GNAT family N-acetyltransferase [Oxalobacteraceae bacterium OTU3CAMAD1]|nr:GNAT family N-acetyltransferase [Oxalobacteraceae bacterium OTU3CAMAD1]